MKGFFKNLFKNVKMGNVGKTILIVAVSIFVLAALIFLFFF